MSDLRENSHARPEIASICALERSAFGYVDESVCVCVCCGDIGLIASFIKRPVVGIDTRDPTHDMAEWSQNPCRKKSLKQQGEALRLKQRFTAVVTLGFVFL